MDVMSVFIGVIVGIFMLTLLVTAHEFGHFLMARKNGVEVEEFGICFPPRAIAWRKVDGKWRRLKKSEWKNMPGEGLVISLNWLPIGGFCQMKGESAADKRKGTFGASSFWSKTKILFGGVAANWLVSIVILTILAWCGMPHFLENQFQIDSDTKVVAKAKVTLETIMEDSPAQKAGLESGDIVTAIKDGDEAVEIATTKDLLGFLADHRGKNVNLSYMRGDEQREAEVLLNDSDSAILGAMITGSEVYRSTWSAPVVGLGTTAQLTGETLKGVGKMVANLFSGAIESFSGDEETHKAGTEKLESARDSVSGPVGIIGVLFPAFTNSGLNNLMFLVALISVSLACMNVLPIPALDGGRWLLIAFYKARKKVLTKETEEKIVGRAFMAILGLAAIITIIDIMRIVMG